MDEEIKNRKRNRVYIGLIFLGIISMIFEIKIYRLTFIDLSTDLFIIFASGLLSFILDFRAHKKTYDYRKTSSLFLSVIAVYIVGIGFTCCSVFMFTNYYFPKEKTTVKQYEILERTTIGGSKDSEKERDAMMTIIYRGKEKQVIFSPKYQEAMYQNNYLSLTIQEGLWGFEIISKKELVNE